MSLETIEISGGHSEISVLYIQGLGTFYTNTHLPPLQITSTFPMPTEADRGTFVVGCTQLLLSATSTATNSTA